MDYFDTEYFPYRQNELYCENVPLKNLADKFGTPAYIYSKKFFIDRFNEFSDAFKTINHKIFFASKSNFNINVMKIFYDSGSGIDVNSEGELLRALKIGADPKRIILTGVGKTENEIRLGLENDILVIKAESFQEIELINKIAGELGKKARLAIRVNPDVDPKTLPYISTGLAENKFGVASDQAFDLFIKSSKMSNIKIHGIDMHIGSQITSVEPYVESILLMTELIKKLKSKGINIRHFDIGGGMGVVYNKETPFTPKQLADAIIPLLMQVDCEIFFEPGRFLTANGGVLLTKVLYTKSNEVKNFFVVDSAMTDILRPSIYGAYHRVQPVSKSNNEEIEADIVGPVCESSDFIAKKRIITRCNQDDLLAIMTAGAYGMTMSSNYNARRRPPEIIVDNENYYVTRSRETHEYLLYDEKLIKDLH